MRTDLGVCVRGMWNQSHQVRASRMGGTPSAITKTTFSVNKISPNDDDSPL